MLYKIQFVFYREKKATAQEILDELNRFVSLIPAWNVKPAIWLIAHPSKEMIAISNETITDETIAYTESMISLKKSFNIVLADENKDDSVLTIWLMNTPVVSDNRYYLTLTISSLDKDNGKNIFSGFIHSMLGISEWDFKFILLDTEQYKQNRKCVFHDRLSVGWMLYLPKIIDKTQVPSASEVLIFDGFGSLIISSDVFDGNNIQDVTVANNIEIELSASGELPLIYEV